MFKSYHRDTLLLCINEANKKEREINERNREFEQKDQIRIQTHYQDIEDISNDIEWE